MNEIIELLEQAQAKVKALPETPWTWSAARQIEAALDNLKGQPEAAPQERRPTE